LQDFKEKYSVALDKRNYKSMEIARKRDPTREVQVVTFQG